MIVYTSTIALAFSLAAAWTEGENIPVWADHMAPYDSPRETYPLLNLPSCEFANLAYTDSKSLSFGQLLAGHRATRSPRLDIRFSSIKKPSNDVITPIPLCTMTLTPPLIASLEGLIRENYTWSYSIDDIPISGPLGRTTDVQGTKTVEIFTHRTFVIYRNKNQIVGCEVISSAPIQLKEYEILPLTYSATFLDTNLPVAEKFRILDTSTDAERRFEVRSACFAIGFAILIAYITLRGSFMHGGSSLKTAWEANQFRKALQPHLFKSPDLFEVFSVAISTGSHLAASLMLSALHATWTSFMGRNYNMIDSFLWSYILTQAVAGWSGGFLQTFYAAKNAGSIVISQLLLWPCVVLVAFMQLTTVQAAYGTTSATSIFGMVLRVLLLLAFVLLPLELCGFHFGRKSGNKFGRHSQPPNLRRPIPPFANIYQWLLAFVVALIPFGVIGTQLYFISEGVFKHRTMTRMMSYVAFGIVAYFISTVATGIAGMCVLFGLEDYRWQWFAMRCGIWVGILTLLNAIGYGKTFAGDLLATSTYAVTTILVACGLTIVSASAVYWSGSVLITRLGGKHATKDTESEDDTRRKREEVAML